MTGNDANPPSPLPKQLRPRTVSDGPPSTSLRSSIKCPSDDNLGTATPEGRLSTATEYILTTTGNNVRQNRSRTSHHGLDSVTFSDGGVDLDEAVTDRSPRSNKRNTTVGFSIKLSIKQVSASVPELVSPTNDEPISAKGLLSEQTLGSLTGSATLSQGVGSSSTDEEDLLALYEKSSPVAVVPAEGKSASNLAVDALEPVDSIQSQTGEIRRPSDQSFIKCEDDEIEVDLLTEAKQYRRGSELSLAMTVDSEISEPTSAVDKRMSNMSKMTVGKRTSSLASDMGEKRKSAHTPDQTKTYILEEGSKRQSQKYGDEALDKLKSLHHQESNREIRTRSSTASSATTDHQDGRGSDEYTIKSSKHLSRQSSSDAESVSSAVNPTRPSSTMVTPSSAVAVSTKKMRPRIGAFLLSKDQYENVKKELSPELFSAMDFKVIPSSSNIEGVVVDTPEQMVAMETVSGKQFVKSGTIRYLVNLLSSQGIAEQDYMVDFLRTYRYFADSHDICRLLALRYLEIGWKAKAGFAFTGKEFGNVVGAAGVANTDWAGFLQLRLLNVIKKWIDSHPADFGGNPVTHDFVVLFLENYVNQDPKRVLYVSSMLKNLREKMTEYRVNASLAINLLPASATKPTMPVSPNTPPPASISPVPLHVRSRTLSEGGLNNSNPNQPNPSNTLTPNSSNTTSHSNSPSIYATMRGSRPQKPTAFTAFNSKDSMTSPKQGHTPIESSEEVAASDSPSSVPGGIKRRPSNKNQLVPSAMSLSLALQTLQPPKLCMADFDPMVVAQQLTIIEHSQFRKIQLSEFFCQAWMEKEVSPGIPNRSRLAALINWFNRVAYGVASEVVLQQKIKDRVVMLKRFIFVADQCLKWNNFNTVFEVVAGLNLGPITRLKKTWKALPSKYLDAWNAVNKAVSSEGSYRNYRSLISTIREKSPDTPILPYLGVNLKDLTFTEDGNPTFLEPPGTQPQSTNYSDKVINFTKFRLISKLFDSIIESQRGKYNFQTDDAIQRWLKTQWVSLDSAELYEQSKICEPKAQA
ncbi:RasGEF [Blyttiomyces sp. JEL0837]|nr:RasGEF [Blyttiomyces sp. JEL0837]